MSPYKEAILSKGSGLQVEQNKKGVLKTTNFIKARGMMA